jgi:predicted kinase
MMSQDTTSPYAILILLRGLPGSGKSYLARALEAELGNDHIISLDPDATDYTSDAYLQHSKQLLTEGVDPKLHVYRFLRAKAYQGISDHKIVMWNQPFTNEEIFIKMIDRMETHAAEQSVKLHILIVEVEVDSDVAKARIAKRKSEGGHGPSDATFVRFMNDYKSFGYLGFDTITVDGAADIAVSTSKIMRHIQNLH